MQLLHLTFMLRFHRSNFLIFTIHSQTNKTNMSPVNNSFRMKKEQADGNLCSIEPDGKQKLELKQAKVLIRCRNKSKQQ